MKKKRFASIMLATSLVVSSIGALASSGKGSQTYSDVDAGVFYDEATYFLNEEGIMTGYKGAQEGEFGPTDVVTRAQVVTTLWRLVGEPASNYALTYSDVTNTSSYYYNALRWATENDIVSGYDDGTFRPKRACTRREVAKMVSEFADIYGYNDLGSDEVEAYDMSQYTDIDDAGWAYDEGYVQWMAYHQIMTGKSATELAPKEVCLRGQWAVIVTRLLTEVEAQQSLVVMKNDPTDINAMMHEDTILTANGVKALVSTNDDLVDYGFKYKSADTSVVTVDANGTMTGVGAPGSQTTVKVTSKLSNEAKLIRVQVGYGAATRIDYVKEDKEDKTVYLESTSQWSSNADLISDIEMVIDSYGKYKDLVFTFDTVDAEGKAVYVAKYDSNTKKVVITKNGEDVTETFNTDDAKTFNNIAITFPDGYNIGLIMADLADIGVIGDQSFAGEFVYRNTVVKNITIEDDFYVSATIDDQKYFFFNIDGVVYAQGDAHEADVTEYNAVAYWVGEGVINATLVQEPGANN